MRDRMAKKMTKAQGRRRCEEIKAKAFKLVESDMCTVKEFYVIRDAAHKIANRLK